MPRLAVFALGIALLLSPIPSFAALVLHVGSVTVTSSPTAQTGSFEVYVQETGGENFTLGGFNIGLRLSPANAGITFTSIAQPTDHPPVFNGTNLLDQTSNKADEGWVAGQDLFVTNFGASDVAIVNGTADGLFRVFFAIAANTTGAFDVLIDAGSLELANASEVLTIDPLSGQIEVLTIPVPLALLMGLSLLPLVALRRRRQPA